MLNTSYGWMWVCRGHICLCQILNVPSDLQHKSRLIRPHSVQSWAVLFWWAWASCSLSFLFLAGVVFFCCFKFRCAVCEEIFFCMLWFWSGQCAYLAIFMRLTFLGKTETSDWNSFIINTEYDMLWISQNRWVNMVWCYDLPQVLRITCLTFSTVFELWHYIHLLCVRS